MNDRELKGVETAQVRKAGVPAARLTRAEGDVVFSYEPGYSGPPIAFTLPRDSAPIRHSGGALPPFFTGLLPEGRRLNAIRRVTKTSEDDELTLLLAVGGDTIGDVQILPFESKEAPRREHGPTDESLFVPQSLDRVDFEELFALAVGIMPRDRAAIPGLQDKVSARMISLPVQHAGAQWILKLNPPEVPHLVENEAFFLGAARASGVDAAYAELVQDRTGRSGLLVRRFDRGSDGEASSFLRALAQEDACQVLGRYPSSKYQLTTEEIFVGLTPWAGAPAVAARDLMRQFAFAYLSGNGDLHGKNISLLRRDEWRVSPAYDLPSSLPYDDHSMALPIAGRTGEDIQRADLIHLGEQAELPPKATDRVLSELLLALPNWIDRLDELPFDARRLKKMRRAIELRADRLKS